MGTSFKAIGSYFDIHDFLLVIEVEDDDEGDTIGFFFPPEFFLLTISNIAADSSDSNTQDFQKL